MFPAVDASQILLPDGMILRVYQNLTIRMQGETMGVLRAQGKFTCSKERMGDGRNDA